MPVAMMLARSEYEPHLLRQAVEESNWRLIDTVTGSGRLMSDSVADAIRRADAVIAVVSGNRDISSAILVEIGIAIGIGKPVMVLWDEACPSANRLPAETRTARLNLTNLDALRFHVRLFLAEVSSWGAEQRGRSRERRPIATAEISSLSRELQTLQRNSQAGAEFQSWVEALFIAAGATSIAGDANNDPGFDLVVGALPGAAVNAPILVEVKTRADGASIQSIAGRLEAAVTRERAALGVIIVLEFKDRAGMELERGGRVVVLGASDLLAHVDAGASLPEVLFSFQGAEPLP